MVSAYSHVLKYSVYGIIFPIPRHRQRVKACYATMEPKCVAGKSGFQVIGRSGQIFYILRPSKTKDTGAPGEAE
jgi:hypothetical protein